jgi:DNA polymerase III subunit alpha
MASGSFAHLHVHSEYSTLDGAAKIAPLLEEALRLGMPAVGITDHGNMFGSYEFHQQAGKFGIKPVIGIEAYLAPYNRFHKKPVFWGGQANRKRGDDVAGGGAYTHMTMLAANAKGLKNLFRLSSLASLEGYYYKPRMDRELIAQHSKGIIATTGCPSGEVQTRLRLGQDVEALQAASDFRDIFGPGNFFLELMDHGLEIERRVRTGLLDIGRKLSLSPLATNDSHYVTRDQAAAHEALLCVQSGKTLGDPNRFRFEGNGYYLKSPAEMRSVWDADVPGACDTSLLIADRVEAYDEVFAFVDRTPKFKVPDGADQSSWLREEVARLIPSRYGTDPSKVVLDRVSFELDLIDSTGFPAYFLVVADICDYARRSGIMVGPGRGSATGSIVAYILGITQLDPLEHRLLFERFINPERVSPPDIDLDFDERRRADVIRYVSEKYGDDRVCQILTFGIIKAKAAIRDASRVLGYPYGVGDRIAKAMPPDEFGKGISLSGVTDPSHPRYSEAAEVRNLYENDQDVRKVIDTACGLEGLTRGTGVHAAGVILCSQPLLDVLPVQRRDDDGAIISGFPFPQCEAMGLLKMDFLGLRNLTVIDDAVRNIKEHRGIDLDLARLPLEDKATFDLMARGDTLGTFQLDGAAMRSLLKAMVPTKFEDIAAVLALYRPGPMAANSHVEYADRKNGRKPVVPIHAELKEPLEEILGETYHLVVYQEQVLAIAQRLAGYSLGKADLLRRAMGKKKKEILEASRAEFMAGMKKGGYSTEAAQAVWDVLLPFSGYGFNKSHTAGYGVVSFWTAYLKANYPSEYMAALLTSVGDDKDKMAVYLGECRRMGIKVLPPDVNESALHFTPSGSDIRFGFGAIRNIGVNVVQSIVSTRHREGSYISFEDFLEKAEPVVCNKRVAESLIKAGAFDSLGHTRRSLVACHEQAVDTAIDVKRQQARGQYDLFSGVSDTGEDIPSVFGARVNEKLQEWDRKVLLGHERDMLGLYVSSHPLEGAEHILARNRNVSIGELRNSKRGDGTIQVAGIIAKVDKRVNKQNGNLWAIVTIEDLEASIEVLFFASVYQLVANDLVEDAVVTVRGRINERDGAVSIVGQELSNLDVSTPDIALPLTLAVRSQRVDTALVNELRRVVEAYPGPRPLQIRLDGPLGRSTLMAVREFSVDAGSEFMGDIKSLLGVAAIVA